MTEIAYGTDAFGSGDAVRLKRITAADAQGAGIGLLVQRSAAPVGHDRSPLQQAGCLPSFGIQRFDPGAQFIERDTGELRGLDDAILRIAPGQHRGAVASQLHASLPVNGIGDENVVDQRLAIEGMSSSENRQIMQMRAVVAFLAARREVRECNTGEGPLQRPPRPDRWSRVRVP